MLILYVKDNCRYSRRVLEALEVLGLTPTIDIRNRKDPKIAQELFDAQGSYEVPYLVDTDADMIVDESEDIVGYLERAYGKGKKASVAEAGPAVCIPDDIV